jgi:hypothetical protein
MTEEENSKTYSEDQIEENEQGGQSFVLLLNPKE